MSNAIIRMLTCGSVDDGKSTLIGRLLVETDSVPHDTVQSARDVRRVGSTIAAGDIDFSLFTDGLAAEREQGITIDVAYRSMALPNGKRLIIADGPGHEEYTRNMVVAASRADIGLVLVNAVRGVRTQTLRHLTVCSLMGVQRIIIAVNKLDALNFAKSAYDGIIESLQPVIKKLAIKDVHFVPISALHGANVSTKSTECDWYAGGTVLELIQSWEDLRISANTPRLNIQSIARTEEFRGISGTVVDGTFKTGDTVAILPGGKQAQISKIVTFTGDLAQAQAGQAVTLELVPDSDATRGDTIVLLDQSFPSSDTLEVTLVWLHSTGLKLNNSYYVMNGSSQTAGVVTSIKSKLNVNTGISAHSDTLEVNEIATVQIRLNSPLPLLKYSQSRDLGNLILVDRATSETMAAGMIGKVIQHSPNVFTQDYDIDASMRAQQLNQRPKVLWLTGLSGSGKSTIANLLEKKLFLNGKKAFVLDGDNLRHGINNDLGFSQEDRKENIRRTAEIAKLMWEAGLIVVVALISPYRLDREKAKALLPEGEFLEIWVNTPQAVCQSRDPKGLYSKAAAGQISNFTGIGQEYEIPIVPDLMLNGEADPESNANRIIELLQ